MQDLSGNGLRHLTLFGLNDRVLAWTRYCRKNNIDVSVIASERLLGQKSILSKKDANRPLECIIKKEASEFRIEASAADISPPAGTSNFYALSIGSPFIFRRFFLEKFERRVFNDHGARLPENRGGGGFSWRILSGDRTGYITYHILEEAIDAGPIIYQKKFVFPDSCKRPIDYMICQEKATICAIPDIAESFLEAHEKRRAFQDESFSSYWPRLSTAKQGFIDWSWSAEEIERFILAFSTPYEGAKTFNEGNKLYILNAIQGERVSRHPMTWGVVFRICDFGVHVAVRDGTLIVTESRSDRPLQVGDRLMTPQSVLEAARGERIIYTPEGLKTS